MTLKNIVENQLQQINATANQADNERLAKTAVDQRLLSSSTTIGAQLGGLAAGFKALTTVVDDVVESLPFSIPNNVTDKLVISQLTDKVPEVQAQLKPPVGADASDLEQITGSSEAVSSSNLNVVIAQSRPDAVAAAVKAAVPSTSTPQLQSIASNTVDLTKSIGTNQFSSDYDNLNQDGLQSALNQSIAYAINPTIANSAVGQLFTSITIGVSKALAAASQGFGSLIENAVESSLYSASNTITKLATINGIPQNIPPSDMKRIISLSSSSDYTQAAKVLRKYSDKPESDLIDGLKKIDNKLSSVSRQPTPGVPVNAKDLEGIKNNWNSTSTTKFAFELIDSKEELITDLRAAKREITEVVVHHTYTGTNISLTAEDIDHITQLSYGFNIPYHYVLTRDGNIQRGRPISVEVDQPFANNHQLRSIHVCFVGGLSSPEGAYNMKDYKKFLSKTSFTRQQWTSFDLLLDAMFNVYPYIQVLGHNSIDPENADPNFDPSEYVQSKFGKKLAFDDPRTHPPFTRDELIKRF